MSLAKELMKQSAEEIANSIDDGQVGSPNWETKEVILNYKLQKNLIVVTWVLAASSIVVSLLSLAATVYFGIQK